MLTNILLEIEAVQDAEESKRVAVTRLKSIKRDYLVDKFVHHRSLIEAIPSSREVSSKLESGSATSTKSKFVHSQELRGEL
jgi:hypothetical protein